MVTEKNNMQQCTISKGIFLILFIAFISSSSYASKPLKIKVSDLKDKIAGAWIGQMIGNIYGLPHENKYVTAPGLENWPYGYTKNLD
jgi:L-cystine uptake protein TcyP (sodium:dicarboxylate symporter family)